MTELNWKKYDHTIVPNKGRKRQIDYIFINSDIDDSYKDIIIYTNEINSDHAFICLQ